MATILKEIPLERIRENPSALRTVNKQDVKYQGLVDSVRETGILNAILVRELPADNGELLYGLIDGLHRYTASCDAGKKTIPAQVMNMSDASAMEAQLIGNIHKIETKPYQYSEHLRRILASNPLLTMNTLAAKLAKTTSWLAERLGLLNSHERIAALIDEGKINLSNGYTIAKLPADEQLNFVDRAMSMTPNEFMPTVLARKKELDTAKRQGRTPKPDGFVPTAFLQKISELKNELDNPTIGPLLCREANLQTAAEGFAMGIKWSLHLDARSIATAEEADKVRRQKNEEEKAKAKSERAQKAAQLAAEAAARVQTA